MKLHLHALDDIQWAVLENSIHGRARDDDPQAAAIARSAGISVAFGALAVAVTSFFYGQAPPAAALPVASTRLAEALVAARPPSSAMWAAGTVGMVGDAVFAAGALLAMVLVSRRGRALEALGWAGIALSNVLFIVVDALVGRVLPGTAALPGDGAVFMASKLLFDALFVAGTLVFGLAALVLLVPTSLRTRGAERVIAALGAVTGLVATLAGFAGLVGADVGRVLGFCIAIGAVLFTMLGAHMASRAQRHTF